MVLSVDFNYVFTVVLSTGVEEEHSYLIPAGVNVDDALAGYLGEVVDAINDALVGKSPVLMMRGPSAVYSARHVVGVKFGGIAQPEVDKLFDRLSRRVGFVQGE